MVLLAQEKRDALMTEGEITMMWKKRMSARIPQNISLFSDERKRHSAQTECLNPTFRINRCAFLFGIMSISVNHFQFDRLATNPAECGTHATRPSFRSKRGLCSSPEAVHRLPVYE